MQSAYLTRLPEALAACRINGVTREEHLLGVQITQALNVGRFSEGQRRYLRFHRESVLLRSKYLEGV